MEWIWALLLLWGSHPEPGGVVENPDPGERAASAPFLAVDADGDPGVAWESGAGDRRIRFALRGEGQGERERQGWAPARELSPGAALEPRVSAGAGRWHVAWQTTGGTSGCRAVWTSDGGRTWSEPVWVSGAAPGAEGARTVSQIALTADATGRVYAAWEEHRRGASERDLFFAVSRDSGTTWSAPVRVDSDAPGSASSFHPSLSATADGHVTVVWWDLRNGLADLYVRRSENGGEGWTGPEVRLDPGLPGKAASHDARLEQRSGELRVIWREGYGNSGAWLQRLSRDGGVTWDDARPAPGVREPVPGESVVQRGEWRHTVRVAKAPGPLEYRLERVD